MADGEDVANGFMVRMGLFFIRMLEKLLSDTLRVPYVVVILTHDRRGGLA